MSDGAERARAPAGAGTELYRFSRKWVPIWCHITDVFQTLDVTAIDGYGLEELREQFDLLPDLIS